MAAEEMSILPRGNGGGLVGVLDVGGRSAQCSIIDTAGTAEVRKFPRIRFSTSVYLYADDLGTSHTTYAPRSFLMGSLQGCRHATRS